MKKYIIALMAFFAMTGNVFAQDKLYVDDVQIPEGGQAELTINLLSEQLQDAYLAFQFDLQLPAGISIADPENDYAQAARLTEATKNWSIAPKLIDAENNIYNFIVYNMPNATIGGTDGPVLYVTLTADASLAIGAELADGIIKNAIISTKEQKYPSAEGTFKIEIIENRVPLDENATTAPAAAENVNVLVKRSVKAGKWNTICLPFAMNETQVKEVFGEKVKVAEFIGCDVEYSGKVASDIMVKFTSLSTPAIEPNIPYIIYSPNAISYEKGFKVDGVTINPVSQPEVVCDQSGRYYNSFVGTYVVIDNLGSAKLPYLFLSNNTFYVATGSTKMKAFRGYFDLYDLLDIDWSVSAKFSMNVDEETTSIEGLSEQRVFEGVYDLSGRKIKLENGDVTKLQKGVYIIDGKKVTIK